MNETGEWIFTEEAHAWMTEQHRRPHASHQTYDADGSFPGAWFFGFKSVCNSALAGGPTSAFNICDYDNGVEDIFL